MIGDLIVITTDEKSGLHFYIGWNYKDHNEAPDPIIGFNLADPQIIEAIHNHDQSIFTILEDMMDRATIAFGIPDTIHAMGLGWEYQKGGGKDRFEAYIQSLEQLLENPFAMKFSRELAESELQAIRSYLAGRKVKAILSQRRRRDFNTNRDSFILALIERDGYQCTECGDVEDLTIDHIIPLSKGGSDDLDNLRLLCRKHNSSKGDQMPKD